MICNKLEELRILVGHKLPCFLCLWDSRTCQEHWTGKVGQREKDLRLVKEALYTFLWLIKTRCYFLVSISKY